MALDGSAVRPFNQDRELCFTLHCRRVPRVRGLNKGGLLGDQINDMAN